MTNKIKNYLLSLLLAIPVASFAIDGGHDVGIGNVASNLIAAEKNLHEIIKAVCITAGAGLILSAIIKYKKHRKNPFEVTMGSIITNLVIGAILIILSFIPFAI